MAFLWPERLWLLLLVPLLVAAYFWALGRRRKLALRYASLALVREAIGAAGFWQRHVPAAVLLAAVMVRILAAARPLAVVTLPTQERTLILAMDVSGSMRATDVEPNRLVASQTAAKAFVKQLPRDVRVGVVSFAGDAQLVQAPTRRHGDVIAAIERLYLQRATATGSAIVVSLAAIFPDAGIQVSDLPARAKPEALEPLSAGSFASAAIVLLTDGQRTKGPDPIDAARMAAARGVRVYTVGFGTKEGETVELMGWKMRVLLDEEALKRIADVTLGEYFYAGNAPDLKKAYDALSSRLVLKTGETEITALFAHAAVVLVLLGAGLSVWWYGRVA